MPSLGGITANICYSLDPNSFSTAKSPFEPTHGTTLLRSNKDEAEQNTVKKCEEIGVAIDDQVGDVVR
jgi:hypothetical protein